MKAEALVSKQWIYDNVFNFTTEDIKKIEKEVIEDKKQEFRLQSIESEGTDPANPPQTDQMTTPDSSPRKKEEDDDKKVSSRDIEDRETYGVRDVLGKYDYTHATRKDNTPDTRHKYRKSPLALAHFDRLKKEFEKKEVKMLNEVEEIENKLDDKNNDKSK